MGQLYICEFDEAPGNYYVCHSCRDTQISLLQDLTFRDTNFSEVIFRKAVNVLFDDPEHYQLDEFGLKANVYCTKCNMKLGWKIVLVGAPTFEIQGGVVIDLNKLLIWDGHQLVNGFTLQPPSN